ncbi:MAG: glucuronate isomerase, partial [Gemmatimonadota bacterium]|nr:glucuronate isomerase [Gemmatimonadota bacterium]
LARAFPENKFLVTFLSRENQHEACITTRKFSNVMLFGCWWFMNNPSIIREITAERVELLGTSFVPQHSDARVLDQLIYKWAHSRELIGEVMVEKYEDLRATGWSVTGEDVARDVKNLFGDNFKRFVGLA